MIISEETKRMIDAHAKWVEKYADASQLGRVPTKREKRVIGSTPFEAGWKAAKEDGSKLVEKGLAEKPPECDHVWGSIRLSVQGNPGECQKCGTSRVTTTYTPGPIQKAAHRMTGTEIERRKQELADKHNKETQETIDKLLGEVYDLMNEKGLVEEAQEAMDNILEAAPKAFKKIADRTMKFMKDKECDHTFTKDLDKCIKCDTRKTECDHRFCKKLDGYYHACMNCNTIENHCSWATNPADYNEKVCRKCGYAKTSWKLKRPNPDR